MDQEAEQQVSMLEVPQEFQENQEEVKGDEEYLSLA